MVTWRCPPWPKRSAHAARECIALWHAARQLRYAHHEARPSYSVAHACYLGVDVKGGWLGVCTVATVHVHPGTGRCVNNGATAGRQGRREHKKCKQRVWALRYHRLYTSHEPQQVYSRNGRSASAQHRPAERSLRVSVAGPLSRYEALGSANGITFCLPRYLTGRRTAHSTPAAQSSAGA